MGSGPRAAALWRQLAADVVDAAAFGGAGLLGGVVGPVVWMKLAGRTGGDERSADAGWFTRRRRVVLWLPAAIFGLWRRDLRSPGYRLLGLRRVDAADGGPVSVRSAAIGELFDLMVDLVVERATSLLSGAPRKRARQQVDRLAPELQGLEREHADDPDGLARARVELYQRHGVDPFAGCGRVLAVPMLCRLTLGLGRRHGRSLRDRLTGTTVVLGR